MTVEHAPTPDAHGAAVDVLNATACEVFNFVGMHHEAHDGLYSIYKALEWACFLISIGLFIFYCQQYRKKTAGWEVIYIAFIESFKYIFEIFWPHENPVQLNIYDTGKSVVWIRYMEWLITCPVILMALSNISGEEGEYTHRSMHLLATDQATILCGITSAASTGAISAIFFSIGVCYGICTFYFALQIYIEAYFTLPETCQGAVKWMAVIFYAGWLCFPCLFLATNWGDLSYEGSAIGHCIADLLSKNAWGVMHWWIRCQLEEYKEHHNGQLPHYSLETRAKMRAEAAHIITGSLGSVLHVGSHQHQHFHFDEDGVMQGAQVQGQPLQQANERANLKASLLNGNAVNYNQAVAVPSQAFQIQSGGDGYVISMATGESSESGSRRNTQNNEKKDPVASVFSKALNSMKGRVSEHFLKDVPPSARPDSPSRRNSGRGGADAPVAQPAQSMKIDLKDLANNPQLQQQLSMMLKGTMNGQSNQGSNQGSPRAPRPVSEEIQHVAASPRSRNARANSNLDADEIEEQAPAPVISRRPSARVPRVHPEEEQPPARTLSRKVSRGDGGEPITEERLQKRPSYRAARAAAPEADDEEMNDAPHPPPLTKRPSARAPPVEMDDETEPPAPVRTASLKRTPSKSPGNSAPSSPSRRVSRAPSVRAHVTSSVLLCDDGGDMGDVFVQQFADVPNARCTVKVVATPDELIDALQAGKVYDFVVVSKNIITSDPEITEEIRAHGQNPLVAFGPELEGASVAEVKATMFELDVDDYIGLPKRGQPYLVDNLEALVHKYKKVADDSNY